MLVLTRRTGQSVYIGDEVKITLVEIKGNQVRIGVDAPPHVRIYREEIYLQILDENRQAAATSVDAPKELKGPEELKGGLNKFKLSPGGGSTGGPEGGV